MHNVYIKDGAFYRLGDGSDPGYFGYFTSGAPIDIQYTNPANGSTGSITAYPAINDEGETIYVSKQIPFNGRIFYTAWDLVYNEELDKDVWEPFGNLVQLHIKKYGRDGKVLSSVFFWFFYDGESVTYNPTREPYSVGEYSGETWVEYYSACTEYCQVGNCSGAYVSQTVDGTDDWTLVNIENGVVRVPKGTKRVRPYYEYAPVA